MAKLLVSDDLWAAIAPLLPLEPPKPKGGRLRLADRAALIGILFVLKSGLSWEMLPAEMGCGSGLSCWRRLRDWQDAGVWTALRRETSGTVRSSGSRARRPRPAGRETSQHKGCYAPCISFVACLSMYPTKAMT